MFINDSSVIIINGKFIDDHQCFLKCNGAIHLISLDFIEMLFEINWKERKRKVYVL